MKLPQRSLKNYNCLNCSLKTRMISFLNFHLLKGEFMYLCFSSAVAQLLSFLDADCVFPLSYNAAWEIYIFRNKIVTQTEMSCCPVAVKLGVQPFIFAVHLKSFRVGVYRVISFSLSVFFVTFLETYFRYPWKHTVLVLMI